MVNARPRSQHRALHARLSGTKPESASNSRPESERRTMMNTKLTKIAAVAGVGLALAVAALPASAQRVGFGVNIGVPVAPAYPAYGYAAPYGGCYYGDPYYPCAPGYYGYGGPY